MLTDTVTPSLASPATGISCREVCRVVDRLGRYKLSPKDLKHIRSLAKLLMDKERQTKFESVVDGRNGGCFACLNATGDMVQGSRDHIACLTGIVASHQQVARAISNKYKD